MKITCDIIKDLIPSYIDDICSEDSKSLVKEHMKDCKSCMEYYKAMAETEFVDAGIGTEEVSYLKKIRHSFLFSALLPILLFVVLTIVRGQISYTGSYVLTFLLLALGLVLQLKSNNHEKPSLLYWILTVVPILYCSVFFLFLTKAAMEGVDFFGIALQQYGPLMDAQLLIAMAVELLVFCLIRFQNITKETTCTTNLLFSLTAMGILVGWSAILHRLDTLDGMIGTLIEVAVVCTAMGAVSVFAYHFTRKIKAR